MPTGTDPKLNQNEKTWGILWDEGNSKFCWYEKGPKDSLLRACCQGSEFKIIGDPIIEPVPADGNDPAGKWRGISINTKVVAVYDENSTGPIYREMNHFIRNVFFDGNIPRKLVDIKNLMSVWNSQTFNSDYSLV